MHDICDVVLGAKQGQSKKLSRRRVWRIRTSINYVEPLTP